jgi:hypothetical protein
MISYYVLCYKQKEKTFSPLQVKSKPSDREMEHAFILGSVDCVVMNTYKVFSICSFPYHIPLRFLSLRLSIPSTLPPFIHICIPIFFHPFIFISLHLSFTSSFHPFISLSIYLSIISTPHFFISPSPPLIYSSLCPSVHHPWLTVSPYLYQNSPLPPLTSCSIPSTCPSIYPFLSLLVPPASFHL